MRTTPTMGIGSALRFIGRDNSDEESARVLGDTVSRGYLATLGLRLEAGRDLAVRGADRLALAPAIRIELTNLHADVLLFDMATVDDRVAQSVGSERLNTLVADAFAVLALLLAAVGVYSIAAQRRYELGVRLALAATARQLATPV